MNKYNPEIEYLNNKISKIQYPPNRFTLLFSDDKFLFGTITPDNCENPFSLLVQYKTLYDTICDLDFKIKISFNNGIEFAYSEDVQNNFSLIANNSKKEILSYYFIENALFRTSSLWDLLSQLYRLFYNIDIPQNKVYYKKFFNPNSNFSNDFKEKATNIHNYISQSDNTDIDDSDWLGNHKYVNKIRNKMTHRNSPNITSLSDYNINFKGNPRYMLKRIIEDYSRVSIYLTEILDEIEKTLKENFAQLLANT